MSSTREDRIWKALADPTRREVLDLLRDRPRTTGELCAHFPALSRTAVIKHVRILEVAQLILVTREGRFRWNHINPVPIQEICERWVSRHVQRIATSMLRLRSHVESGDRRKSTARRGATDGKKRKETPR